MVLRLTSGSPRGPGLIAPVAPEKLPSQELDASVGASGPHDFAVRIKRPSSKAQQRPPHPMPNVADDHDTPLEGARDGAIYGCDLPLRTTELFSTRRGDVATQ